MSPHRTDSTDVAHAGTRDARRFDVGTGDLLKVVRRAADGAMFLEGVPVREGVLRYRNADGSERLELVTRQAVIDTASGCRRAVVTLEHPVNDAGEAVFVDPDNVQKYQVGDVDGDTEVTEIDDLGGFGRVRIAARRRDAIDAIETDKAVQLSPGYNVTLDETPGEHPVHGRYDARQVGRQINHLAIVAQGRGGPAVRLRTDSTDAVQIGRVDSVEPTPPERIAMKPHLIQLAALFGVARTDSEDGLLAELLPAAKAAKKRADEADEVEAAAEKTDEDMEAMKAAMVAKDAEIEALKKECDELKGKVDTFEKAAADRKDAEDLAAVRALADKVGVKHEGIKLDALRLAVARTAVKDLPDNASAARIDGVLDVVRAAPADTRYDGWMGDRKPPQKVAADPNAPKVNVDPWARHDDAHIKIHGGAL